MQRTVARVLAAFLFSDRDSVTAAELGEQLGASAGSISTAITVVRAVALIEPPPVPGSRRAHYRMRDDAWSTLMSSHNSMIQLMPDVARPGAQARRRTASPPPACAACGTSTRTCRRSSPP